MCKKKRLKKNHTQDNTQQKKNGKNNNQQIHQCQIYTFIHSFSISSYLFLFLSFVVCVCVRSLLSQNSSNRNQSSWFFSFASFAFTKKTKPIWSPARNISSFNSVDDKHIDVTEESERESKKTHDIIRCEYCSIHSCKYTLTHSNKHKRTTWKRFILICTLDAAVAMRNWKRIYLNCLWL